MSPGPSDGGPRPTETTAVLAAGHTYASVTDKISDIVLSRPTGLGWYAGFGISMDESKARFADKYSIGFPLLADPDHAIAEQYGVWQEKKYAGRTYMGIHRSTFVIAPDGTVEEALYGVRADGHADLVLGAVTAS